MNVSVISGIAYGPSGQRLDVYCPEAATHASPIVLPWHGRGPNERDVLTPLARATAAEGLVCFVPDWRPDAEDAGRAHLRESARFVQQNAADFAGDAARITLAGWSLGGKTAVAVAPSRRLAGRRVPDPGSAHRPHGDGLARRPRNRLGRRRQR
jgi:acetyl esterase/lipase